MRHEDQLFKTMSAVQGCLNECLRAQSPWSALSHYVQSLRRNPQWNDHEVAEVETAARRALEAASCKHAGRP
jgi:hypothetical protein